MPVRAFGVLALLAIASPAGAQHAGHAGMRMDADGIVMNENFDRLPRGCTAISEDVEFTIHAGSAYADHRPGIIYGMSQHEVRVPSCSRLTIHFVNEDQVRHQWMVHGLPKYLYPAGMFHIEAMGGSRQSGTFIVPAGDQTYLVHCDMAQHMEKGMRAQLVVGRGSGNLWAVTGITDAYRRNAYLPPVTALLLAAATMAAFVITVILTGRRRG